MKVIVINDSDGHTNVLSFNAKNLAKTLEAFVEAGMCEDEEGAKNLLANEPTAEQLEQFMVASCPVNIRGGQCYFLEVAEWNYFGCRFEAVAQLDRPRSSVGRAFDF